MTNVLNSQRAPERISLMIDLEIYLVSLDVSKFSKCFVQAPPKLVVKGIYTSP